MNDERTLSAAYEFAGFRLEPRHRVLTKDGTNLEIGPKAFDALVHLVEHAGTVVTRDELTQVLWPRAIVEDNSLNKLIATLRRALGDERCIATLQGRGYQFVADVRIVSPDTDVAALRAPPERQGSDEDLLATAVAPVARHWRRALPAVAALVLGFLLASEYLPGVRPPAVGVETLSQGAVSRFVIAPPPTVPLANLQDVDVAISRDGGRIAYWAQKPESGNIELYVRDLAVLDPRAIPGTEHPPGVRHRNPFFSPDGEWIGYQTPERDVVVVALDGQRSYKMADSVTPSFVGGSWNADDSVIFSSELRLERVSAAGGGTAEPLMPPRSSGGLSHPMLLPGGHAVIFAVFGDSAGDRVAALDLETRKEKTIIEGASNAAYLDTGHLVFARGDTLMAVPFDAEELAVTGEPVALVQGIRRSSGGPADYALSANGTLVYVPRAPEAVSETAVVWVDRTGRVVGRAVDDLVANPRDPRLSPDSERLLLVTGPGTDGDLWSYDLRGRPPIPLALPNDNRFPVWSPDGERVAFIALGSGGVVTVASDGSDLVPRALRTETLLPQVWSAAGELIYFRDPGDIGVTPAAQSGELRNVVASESVEIDAALSPDGRWLAYASDRTGQNEIWVQRYPDGVPQRVSRTGGYEPLWSAGGRELFYRQRDTIMAVAMETGDELSFAEPQPLFSGAYVQHETFLLRSYDVARDGRFLMLLPEGEHVAAAAASIVVVQNFGQELQQRVRPREQ